MLPLAALPLHPGLDRPLASLQPYPVDMWARAFVLTLVVELPIYVALLGRLRRCGSPGRRFVIALLANAATHPAVWYLIPPLVYTVPDMRHYVLYFVVAESWAWLGEAAMLWLWDGPRADDAPEASGRITWPEAIGVALAANAASVAGGFAIRLIVPWF